MRVSSDPILSKSFSDMSDIEFELAKLEISKIVEQLLSGPHSSDFKQGVAVALLAGSVGSLKKVSILDEPEEEHGEPSPFEEEPDPFTGLPPMEDYFKKVDLPKEEVRLSEPRRLEAKRKHSPGDTQFAVMAKELAGRTE